MLSTPNSWILDLVVNCSMLTTTSDEVEFVGMDKEVGENLDLVVKGMKNFWNKEFESAEPMKLCVGNTRDSWWILWTRSNRDRKMIVQYYQNRQNQEEEEDESLFSEWILYEWVPEEEVIKVFTPYNFQDFFKVSPFLPHNEKILSNLGYEIGIPIAYHAEFHLFSCNEEMVTLCSIPKCYMETYSNDWNVTLLKEIINNENEFLNISGSPMNKYLVVQKDDGESFKFSFNTSVEDDLFHVQLQLVETPFADVVEGDY